MNALSPKVHGKIGSSGRTPTHPADPVEIRELPEIADVSGLYPWLHPRRPGTVILETCIPPGGSILAWDPAATVSVRAGTVEVLASRGTDLPPSPVRGGAVPRFLQAILARLRTTRAPGEGDGPLFQGGFIGVVGYEWAAGQEGPVRPTQEGVPDLWFGLYDRALVTDGNGSHLVVVPSIRGATSKEVRTQLTRALTARRVSRMASEVHAPVILSHDFPRAAYEEGVREVRRSIRRGDVYQVNIAQRIRARGPDPWRTYTRLKAINPSPYAGMLSTGDFTLVSASPERVLHTWLDERSVRWAATRPIAGTRPRASGETDVRNEQSLRRSPKERAEHAMLVDLSRNDLGRVAEGGSVEVDELFTVERYSHVMHLVSNVRGRLKKDVGVPELFQALMPGGSVTGTPKIRATEIIADVEPVPRGAYTGSLGYLSLDGRMDFNLLIRSAFFPGGSDEVHLYSGSGIVHDSNPSREWRETRDKAAALVESIQGGRSHGFPWAPPRRHSDWQPPGAARTFPGSRVLLIDNYDSFTYNLAQYLSALGARVSVVRNDGATLKDLKALRPTHVVISPGPGKASESGLSVPAVRAFEGIPLLGVCLGHQAIAEAYGGTTDLADLPVHGKRFQVRRLPTKIRSDILAGLPSTFLAGRYHSLVVGTVPSELVVTAKSDTGEVMALQHRNLPTYGVQFHPESILTEHGMDILSNFLSISPTRGRKP